MIRFVVDTPKPLMSSNDQRRWSWPKVRQAKSAMSWEIAAALKSAGVGRIGGPVEVGVTWFVSDRRKRDVDSLGPWSKALLDTMTDRGIIEDDHYRIVSRLSLGIEFGVPARIEVSIQEKGMKGKGSE